ncbi:hypothetical protein C8J56DRAFT_708256, partial [Mycena floridula]
ELLINGRPGLMVPSESTIARDIKASFECSVEKVSQLLSMSLLSSIIVPMLKRLQEYPGKISFTSDAWTSPNHRAFVAWTAHFQHQGKLVSFMIDIYEVPQVC